MKPHPKLAHRVIEGRAFIMDPRDSTLHTLNETGTLVWRQAAAGRGPDAIARALADDFEVGVGRARRDAESMIASLREKGLLVDE